MSRTKEEVAALSRDVDKVIVEHVADRRAEIAEVAAKVPTLSLRFDIDPGNLNSGVPARCTILSSKPMSDDSSVVPMLSSTGASGREAATAALVSLEQAVEQLRAFIDLDTNW